jgi:hypothetical protein
MATAETNEKRLDEAEFILRQVLKDVNYNATKYSAKDRKALMDAWVTLNGVTLRKDI